MKKRKTDKQMRVAIALDVLKQLKARKLIPTKGVYVRTTDGPLANQPYGVDAQPILLNPQRKKCTVCALGAGVIAQIRLEDNYNIGDAMTTHQRLGRYFNGRQLIEIEALFEVWDTEKILGRLSKEKRLLFLWSYVSKHPDFTPEQLVTAAIRKAGKK